MQPLINFFLLMALLAQMACGEGFVDASFDRRSQQPVVGGQPSGANQFRHTGAVLTPFTKGLCSGTLIAPDVVLTAAHCLVEWSKDGEINLETVLKYHFVVEPNTVGIAPRAAHLVRGSVVHPDFKVPLLLRRTPRDLEEAYALARLRLKCGAEPDLQFLDQWLQCAQRLPLSVRRSLGLGGTGLHRNDDMALLFLETPVADVEPAKLARRTDTAIVLQAAVEIVGYGRSHTEPEEVDAGLGTRNHLLTQIDELGPYEMRVGTKPPQACYGDSGGPAFFGPYLVGVASRLYSDINCESGAIYERVDAYIDWISSELQNACHQGIRVHDICQK